MPPPPLLTSGHHDPRQDLVTGVRGRETTVCQLDVFLSHQVEDRLCEELQKKKKVETVRVEQVQFKSHTVIYLHVRLFQVFWVLFPSLGV